MPQDHTLVTMLVFILCASISLALATPVNNVYSLEDGHKLFETFIKEHNKQYEGKEKEERFQIFLDNLKEIISLNEKSSNAVFGITMFTDLTKEEFIQTYTGFKESNLINRKNGDQVLEPFNYTAPDEFDWRSKGVVSRVKSQARCGSCWAFSITGNVESINAIKTGSIVDLSQQQLVDCNTENHGCSGGNLDIALNYLVQNGAMSEESYPYEGQVGSCRYDTNNVVVHISRFDHLRIDEQEIKEKLYTNGPLSIVIDAHVLRNYHGGIIIDRCADSDLNHAVLIVGYGQENGVDYWLVKNSWGESWGEQGYFRMQRGVNCLSINLVGVLTAVI